MSNSLSMTGTFSKHPRAWGFEEGLQVIGAQGAELFLSDGGRYIDWVSGLGTNLFGYGYFSDALAAELANGTGSPSLPHRSEYEAAEMLADLLRSNIPYWASHRIQVRFALSGTEAVTMAVRLARAATGANSIICLKGGYHGWADWTTARTEPAYGVVPALKDYVAEFDFNDLDSLEDAASRLKNLAAVVIEQGLTEPDPGFYEGLRAFCDRTGALLIMDEVVTGLRYGLGGVCQKYNIKPDLVCMGKAIGNGLPVSALVGRADLMCLFAKLSPVFCSSTHWGNSLNMAGVKLVLENFGETEVLEINYTGHRLMEGLSQAGWRVVGDPARSLMVFDSDEEKAFFVQGMRDEEILMNRPNFPTLSHTDEIITDTIQAAQRVRLKFKAALERGVLAERVKGKIPKGLFSDR